MTLKIQGRSVADGNLGNITDFTQIEADEGRIFETVDNSNNLLTWIVSATNNGGNAISGGLYANPLNTSPALPRPIMSLPFGINQIDEFINGSVSCVRATEKTYTDIYGVLRTAPVNALAIEPDGVLIEGSSTNQILYSEDSTNSEWVKSGVTSLITLEDSPKLSNNANRFIESSSQGAHLIYILPSSQPVQGETASFSAFFKPEQRTGVLMRMVGESGVEVGANFNSLDGAFSSVSSGVSVFSQNLGDGWFRLCISYTFSSTITSPIAGLCRLFLLDESLSAVYQGDGVSGALFWGFQFEKLPFCTSYIKTTTAPATRAADNVTIPTLNNYIGQNEGAHTVYVKASTLSDSSRILSGKSTAGQNDKYNIDISSSIAFFSNGSTSTCQINIAEQSNLNALTLTFDGSKSLPYLNGVAGTESLAVADSLLDFNANLTIGSVDGASQNMYGHVKDVKIFNVALSADQIKLLG